jgi:hypothetical protein
MLELEPSRDAGQSRRMRIPNDGGEVAEEKEGTTHIPESGERP